MILSTGVRYAAYSLIAALAFIPILAHAQDATPYPAPSPLPDYATGFDAPASFTGDGTMDTTGLAVKLKPVPDLMW